MQKVDRTTVKALELTAPGACKADFQDLYGKVRKGKIFGAFDEEERECIWSRVLSASVDRLIPFLFSFFEDLNYLKNVADCMKRLIPLSPRGTVSSALEDAFSDANHRAGQCLIQESEFSCVFRPGSLAERVDLGRRQIWMCAMRGNPQMPAEPKRKNLSAKPIAGKADEIVLCEFATLAYRLGYESEPIHSLIQRSADREIARSALLKARKPDRYKYSEAAFEDYVGQIVSLFSEAQPLTVEQASVAVEINCSDEPPKRCGIPHTQDHERDKLSLFLDKLHNTDEEQCDEMSSFFIRRSVYFAFFGKPSRPIPRSPEEITLLDTPISAHLGDDQVREEQERLIREEQERLARQEQERLAREEQEREEQQRLAREQERLAREEQERLAREEQERLAREQERLAKEEQERLAKEEQERLAKEERERQERLAGEERERLARAEQERLAREEQERLAREEQERIAREEQQRLAREEQERLAREEQERLAREQERLAREEQERLAREEQDRLARVEQERLAREEQERLAKENQERLAREEQERIAKEEQERLAREEQERLAREEQERLAREEQERLAKEEQERLAREEQERLAREEQERLARAEQERLAREEQERLARAEQERLAREEQERLARVEQERLAREKQEKLARKEQERQKQAAREEQERLAREEQERLAREEQERQKQAAMEEQERLAREEQERLAREEQERQKQAAREQDQAAQADQEWLAKEEERVTREEEERLAREEPESLAEKLGKRWKGRQKQKKPNKNQLEQKGSKAPRSKDGVQRGLRASVAVKRRERPLTQFELKKVINGESSEANDRFVPPSKVFEFSLGAAEDQVEVDTAGYSLQTSSDSSVTGNATAASLGKLPQHASDSREQNQAVEPQVRT
jgi:hypothetical protein